MPRGLEDGGTRDATRQFLAAEQITMDLKQWVASARATRGYMSPEQTEMTGQDIDTRTDV